MSGFPRGGSGGGGGAAPRSSPAPEPHRSDGDYTVAQVTGAAPSANPTFTGTVTVPTATTGPSAQRPAAEPAGRELRAGSGHLQYPPAAGPGGRERTVHRARVTRTCVPDEFHLTVTPARVRFRIRNSNLLANTNISQALVFSGALLGVPNVGAETQWNGDFTGAPVDSGIGAFTVDPGGTGAEYVSAWIAPATWNIVANTLYGLSFGFTVAVDGKVNIDGTPGWLWHSATNVGLASTANFLAAAPAVGTAVPYGVPLDIRLVRGTPATTPSASSPAPRSPPATWRLSGHPRRLRENGSDTTRGRPRSVVVWDTP